MEKFIKSALQLLVKTIPFSFVKRTCSGTFIILYCHVVNDEDVPHIDHLYKYKGTREFYDDIEFLLKEYSPIGLPDVIDWAKGKIELSPDCFLLTFDDGLREIDDVIAPFLLRKGIPATFFISSAFLDNRELCYQHKASLLVEKIRQGISPETERQLKRILLDMGLSFSTLSEGILKINYRQKNALDRIAEIVFIDFKGYLKEKQPYLTSNQVNKLIEKGFTIGAHSIDHPHYSALTLGEQLEQTIISTKYIREKFGLDYGAFAFPHNDTNVTSEFFQKVQESKWIDITFGTDGMLDGDSRSHRQRVYIENPLMAARELIAWQYLRKRYRQFRIK